MKRKWICLLLVACLVLGWGASVWAAVAPLDKDGGDMNTLVTGVNALAVDLYGQLAGGTAGNLFFSPASIDTALAMTYAGAAGQTAQQMATTLHYDLPMERLHAGFAGLIQTLNQPEKNYRGKPAYELTVANALWGQQGYPFKESFTQLVSKTYGAGLSSVDFAQHTEEARQTINAWVARKTAEKIMDLIGPGSLDPRTTVLVLTNAVYFKSNWVTPFAKQATKDGPFTVAPGKIATAAMMHLTGEKFFGYLENEDLQAVDLPYESGALTMVVLLPRKVDGLAGLEKKLTGANLAAWLGGMQGMRVDVALPRFKFASQFDLGKTLEGLGMTDAFSGDADFSGITSAGKLAISEVVHKAYVAVDEDGTEAAAATAVAIGGLAKLAGEPKSFVADHPFVFLIRHRATGCVLFLGRVADPTGK
jgi:serpin B